MIRLGYILGKPMQNFFDLTQNEILLPSIFGPDVFDSGAYTIMCYGDVFGFYRKHDIFVTKVMRLPNWREAEKIVAVARHMGFRVICRRNRFLGPASACRRMEKCRALNGVVEKDLERYLESLVRMKEKGGTEIEENIPGDEWIDWKKFQG